MSQSGRRNVGMEETRSTLRNLWGPPHRLDDRRFSVATVAHEKSRLGFCQLSRLEHLAGPQASDGTVVIPETLAGLVRVRRKPKFATSPTGR